MSRALLAALVFLFPSVASAAGSIDAATIRTGESALGDITISAFEVPAGASDAALGVCIAGTGTLEAVSATWGSSAMDLGHTRLAGAVSADFYYLQRPTPGTDDLTIGVGGAGNYTAIAFVIEDVANAAPEATADGTVTTTSITTNVTTVSANAFVVDCLAMASALSDPATTQAGQTERQQFNPTITTPRLSVSDKQGPGTPGSTGMGWNGLSNTTRTVQVVVAFAGTAAPQSVRGIVGPGIIEGPR